MWERNMEASFYATQEKRKGEKTHCKPNLFPYLTTNWPKFLPFFEGKGKNLPSLPQYLLRKSWYPKPWYPKPWYHKLSLYILHPHPQMLVLHCEHACVPVNTPAMLHALHLILKSSMSVLPAPLYMGTHPFFPQCIYHIFWLCFNALQIHLLQHLGSLNRHTGLSSVCRHTHTQNYC